MTLVLSTTLAPPAVPTSSSHRGEGGFRRRADGRARRAAAVSAVSSGRGGLWGASSHHILGGDERFGGGGGDKRTIASIASGCGSGWRQRPVGLGRLAPMVVVVKASNEVREGREDAPRASTHTRPRRRTPWMGFGFIHFPTKRKK